MSDCVGQRPGLPWVGQRGSPSSFVILLGKAVYSLAAQGVKQRDSADFSKFSPKYSFNVNISGTGILRVLINCS